MKAKENTRYAILTAEAHVLKVSQIFTSNEVKEWDENSLFVVEIPQNQDVSLRTNLIYIITHL